MCVVCVGFPYIIIYVILTPRRSVIPLVGLVIVHVHVFMTRHLGRGTIGRRKHGMHEQAPRWSVCTDLYLSGKDKRVNNAKK